MDKETLFQDYKGVLVAAVAVIVLGIVLLLNFSLSNKQVSLKAGEPSLKAGEPYTIAWSASNVARVGIALFNGDKPQWIVQNYDAAAGKYVWDSDPYQAAGADYRIAVFAYPWKKGNPIVYSPSPITVVGQKYVSCDDYSVENSWPFLSDSYPNLHKVFITNGVYSGNMGGVSGADASCAQEAKKNNYPGNYVAFLGTDSKSAAERIAKDGIFVEAEPIGTLAEGRSCHRMVAENLQKLLDKSRLAKNLAQVELSDVFYKRLGDVWFGRRTSSTETKCLAIAKQGVVGAFSGSYTCQDWSISKRQVYAGTVPAEADLPRCYDAEGKNLKANYYGAVASDLDDNGNYVVAGDTCESSHRLLCVEQ
jgi:hypothetical protein